MKAKAFLLPFILPMFIILLGVTAQPSLGKTLRVGMTDYLPPEHLNPLVYSSPKSNRFPAYSYLLRFNETGLFSTYLAYSWDVSEDGLNYTFYLFNNITWHDGTKFNASDVKFTYDTLLTDPNILSVIQEFYNSILSYVEIMDEYTVRFHLKNPFPSFLSMLASGYDVPILPKHLYEGTDLSTNPYNYRPIGTGAFKVLEFNPGINLTVTFNEDYFKGRPRLDKILFRWDIPLEQLPDFLLNNTIDLVPENIDPNRIEELKGISGISITTVDEMGYFSLGINLRNSVLSNTKVRQALARAINKTEIVEHSYLGYARPATGPISPALSYWYNPNVPTYDYNTTRAEEILDEEGYLKDGRGVRFNISLIVGDWDHLRVNVSKIIRDYLQDIGINVTLQIETEESWRTSLLTQQFGLIIVGFSKIPDPEQKGWWETGGWANFWSYSNSTMDSLIEQGTNTANQTLRKEIYDEIQEILAEDLPNIFLYHRIRVNDHNNDFHDFVATPSTLSIDSYSLEKVWYNETLSGEGESPMLIAFIDSEGRRTGYDPTTGEGVENIPNTRYSGVDVDPQLVKILSPIGNYTIELIGTGDGSYKLEIVNLALEYKHVGIARGTIQEGQVKHYNVTTLGDGSMTVSADPPEDIYSDGQINIRDISIVARAFGSYPGHKRWNPLADVNNDFEVNIRDISRVARLFGKIFR